VKYCPEVSGVYPGFLNGEVLAGVWGWGPQPWEVIGGLDRSPQPPEARRFEEEPQRRAIFAIF